MSLLCIASNYIVTTIYKNTIFNAFMKSFWYVSYIKFYVLNKIETISADLNTIFQLYQKCDNIFTSCSKIHLVISLTLLLHTLTLKAVVSTTWWSSNVPTFIAPLLLHLWYKSLTINLNTIIITRYIFHQLLL